MIIPQVLLIFAPYSPWHNLQQFKYRKKIDSLYFLNAYVQVASTASKIKHTDVYHQDINYNRLYLLYYPYNKHCNQ